jgi:hypothetical protein
VAPEVVVTLAAGITGNPKADTVLFIALVILGALLLAGGSNK